MNFDGAIAGRLGAAAGGDNFILKTTVGGHYAFFGLVGGQEFGAFGAVTVRLQGAGFFLLFLLGVALSHHLRFECLDHSGNLLFV